MNENKSSVKIIYKLKMELLTALHIGIGTEDTPIGASDIFRNGAGEFCISGKSIGGVFFDTVLAMDSKLADDILFQKCCDKNNKSEKNDNHASPIVFRSTLLNPDKGRMNVKIRDRVRIQRETKTAADGAKFAQLEIEPDVTIEENVSNYKNLHFNIFIEIDNLSMKLENNEISTIINWIETVLYSWNSEGVMFGAFNSSGCGWAKLASCEIFEVDSEEKYSLYLKNSDYSNFFKNEQYFKDVTLNKPENYSNIFEHYNIKVELGDEDDGYGTNALLIKGGDSNISLKENPVDGIFIHTEHRLFIPGSSLKGAVSLFLEKYGKKKDLLKYFGQPESNDGEAESGGYFYFQDLFADNHEHLKTIERHAEDEFTRAIFGGAKFNEERLFYSTFTGKLMIRKKIKDEKDKNGKVVKISEDVNFNKEAEALCEFIKQGFDHRLISLGANSAYPKITIEKCG